MLVQLQNVTISYPNADPLYKNINAALQNGEIVVLQGNPGEGLSSVLKSFAGLVEPVSGNVLINGKSLWHSENLEQRKIRHEIGFAFQEGGLLSNMTAEGNMMLSALYAGADEAPVQERVGRLFDALELTVHKSKNPANLTPYLKRRLRVARAMLVGKTLFVFDESFGHDDELLNAVLTKFIEAKKKTGAAFLIGTKNVDQLKVNADRIWKLNRNSLSLEGDL